MTPEQLEARSAGHFKFEVARVPCQTVCTAASEPQSRSHVPTFWQTSMPGMSNTRGAFRAHKGACSRQSLRWDGSEEPSMGTATTRMQRLAFAACAMQQIALFRTIEDPHKVPCHKNLPIGSSIGK
eukprot:1160108-Pelagomonas_calceolata.AAC.5